MRAYLIKLSLQPTNYLNASESLLFSEMMKALGDRVVFRTEIPSSRFSNQSSNELERYEAPIWHFEFMNMETYIEFTYLFDVFVGAIK